MLFGSVADMRRAESIHDPGTVVAMGDERADADDRMVDVFREFIADRFPHFIVRARAHIVCRGVAAQIGHSLQVQTMMLLFMPEALHRAWPRKSPVPGQNSAKRSGIFRNVGAGHLDETGVPLLPFEGASFSFTNQHVSP